MSKLVLIVIEALYLNDVPSNSNRKNQKKKL